MAGDFSVNASGPASAPHFKTRRAPAWHSPPSANGAAHASPGQRPGSASPLHPALKGRPSRCPAPAGLGLLLAIEPNVRRNMDRNQPSTRPTGRGSQSSHPPSPLGRRAGDEGRFPLDPATAALFPDQLEDSPLGHTPKGWEIRSLDKTAHYLNGLALQKYPPGGGPTLPVIEIAQLRKGDSVGAYRCNTDLPPAYIIQDGDVLFSWSGSLEVKLWCGDAGALNQNLFKVTSPELPKWVYYLWTLYHLDEVPLIAADKATTMGHIQRGHLTASEVLIPTRPLLDAITRTMSPVIEQIIANRIQSRTLATLRNTLLPKLLSGELSVAETSSTL